MPNSFAFLLSIKAAHDIEHMLAADIEKVVAKTFSSNEPKVPERIERIAIPAVRMRKPINNFRNIRLASSGFILIF